MAIGYGSLYNNLTGIENTSIGHMALYKNTIGSGNVGIGMYANFYNQAGSNNTAIGYKAGQGTALHDKSGNVFLGYKAGYNESGDNKLYIENSGSATPLIYGDFDSDILAVNGQLGVGTHIPDELLHVAGNARLNGAFEDKDGEAGTSGQVLSSTVTGTDWVDATESAFTTTSNVTSNAPGVYAIDDFVFGSPSLNDDGNSDHDNRFFFDKAKGAFRAGSAWGTYWDDANRGSYSFASGVNNTASGTNSTAMGSDAIASGRSSIAIGGIVEASGFASIAMGFNNVASGGGSTAIGSDIEASGNYSTAIGVATLASGNASTATGFQTKSESFASFATGKCNIGGGSPTSWVATDPIFEIGIGADNINRANAVTVLKNGNLGIGTHIPDESLHVAGNARLDGAFEDKDGEAGTSGQVLSSTVTGTDWVDATEYAFTTTSNITSNAPGSYANDDFVFGSNALEYTYTGNPVYDNRFYFDKSKGAFRAGQVSSSVFWNDAQRGEASVAMGWNTKASGLRSTAFGDMTEATGDYSTALGYHTDATGLKSTAFGSNTLASGEYSVAMGYGSTASGHRSTAAGFSNTAQGYMSTAIGNNSSANGNHSIAIGNANTAGQVMATAIGCYNTASGAYSTAFGDHTTASNSRATSMGYYTTASGYYSMAVGDHTKSESNSSFALGRYNVGGGHVYNWNGGDPIFEIGIGSNNNRANAVTVLKNGNVGIGTHIPDESLHVGNNMRLDGSFEDKDGESGTSGQILSSTGSGIDWINAPVPGATNINGLTDGKTISSSVFLGANAGTSNTNAGEENVGVGIGALSSNVTGDYNTANGYNALSSNTSGSNNTAFGNKVLLDNISGAWNTATGSGALNKNTTGNRNTANGHLALGSNISGNDNTALGYAAGYSNNNSGSVFLGYTAGFNETGSNKLYIENSNSSAPLIYGDFATDKVRINGSLNVTQAFEDKDGEAGTAGQILSSTGSGTDWINTPSPNFVGARAFANAITMLTNTETLVAFGNENYDTDNAFASNYFTAPSNGYYQINASVGVPSPGCHIYLRIKVGGVTKAIAVSPDNTSINRMYVNVSDILYLASASVVTIWANTTHPTNLAIPVLTGDNNTFISIGKLGN